MIEKPVRKPRKPGAKPSRPHPGSLNYHLETLAVGESYWLEIDDPENVNKMHAKIQTSIVRLPGSMEGMRFKSKAFTCVSAVIGSQICYAIRIERVADKPKPKD